MKILDGSRFQLVAEVELLRRERGREASGALWQYCLGPVRR